MKLCQIKYKMNNIQRFCGLQFIFNNGEKSQLFETDTQSKKEWETADIDPSDTIGSIEIYVTEEKGGKYAIQALRFRDKYGVSMQCISMEQPKDKNKWVKQKVPKGYDLIGIQCSTVGDTISKLGFVIWVPNQVPEPLSLKPHLQHSW